MCYSYFKEHGEEVRLVEVFIVIVFIFMLIYFGLGLNKAHKCNDGAATDEIEKLMLKKFLKYGVIDLKIALHDIKEFSYNKQIDTRKCSAYATIVNSRGEKQEKYIIYTIRHIPITEGGGTLYRLFEYR